LFSFGERLIKLRVETELAAVLLEEVGATWKAAVARNVVLRYVHIGELLCCGLISGKVYVCK
jgi:hypothetical protein